MAIQRTATQRVPTRTVAGSYEAPVEGIVDYSAFQRGFESTFKIPEQKQLTDEFDSSVDGLSAQQGDDISFSALSLRSLNKTIRNGFGLDNLSKKAGIAKRDGDVETFNQVSERLEKIIDGRNGAEIILKTSANYYNVSNQRGATQFAKAKSGRGLYADGLAESISKGNATFGFGKDENGNEVAGLYVRNYNVDFKGESKEAIFKQAQGTIDEARKFDIKSARDYSKPMQPAGATITADDFFIPTEGITEENLINKYFPPRADLQNNFAEINKDANLDNFKITADDILEVNTSNQYISSKTGNIITSDSEEKIISERGYQKIDFAADSAANKITFSDKYNENKEALYQDVVFGESGKKITIKTPISKYIKGFGVDGFMGYKEEDFKKVGANGKIGGDIPLNIKNELIKQYSIDKYKVQFGEGAYYYDENNHAKKTTIPVDEKTVSKLDSDTAAGLSIEIGGASYSKKSVDLVRAFLDRTNTVAFNPEEISDYVENTKLTLPNLGTVLITPEMVDVDFKEIKREGKDKGTKKAVIKLKIPVENGDPKEFEFDLRENQGIEKYLGALFSGSGLSDKEGKLKYKSILEAIRKQRLDKKEINNDYN